MGISDKNKGCSLGLPNGSNLLSISPRANHGFLSRIPGKARRLFFWADLAHLFLFVRERDEYLEKVSPQLIIVALDRGIGSLFMAS